MAFCAMHRNIFYHAEKKTTAPPNFLLKNNLKHRQFNTFLAIFENGMGAA
jgi:hypothetical protein